MADVMEYRGRARLALIRDLAMGEWSSRELADACGTDIADITRFAETFADEVTEVRAALAGRLAIETSGLWVTKKQNRLAEYQADIEDLDLVLRAMRAQAEPGSEDTGDIILGGLGSRRHHSLIKSKLALFKAVADEIEPRGRNITATRDEEDSNVVRYVIEAGSHRDSLT
jgi:hypothetical protein